MKNMFKAFVRENPEFLKNIKILTPEEQIVVIDFLDSLKAEKERQRRERTPKYKKQRFLS